MRQYKFEPKYPISQIQIAKYTDGDEYILYHNHEPYIGLYHILPNGEAWTDEVPNRGKTKLLIEKKNSFIDSEDVAQYNKINEIVSNEYISPEYYFPVITNDQYKKGFIKRYFVQKRNNPLKTIIEIDWEQYIHINNNNIKGINKIIWRGIVIIWSLDKSRALELNKNELDKQEIKFPGIKKYLSNLLEFAI